MAAFVNDTFTDEDSTLLAGHTGETGVVWIDAWGWNPGLSLPPEWEWDVTYTMVDYATIRALFTSLQPNCVMLVNDHEFDLVHSDMIEYEEPIDGAIPSNNLYPANQSDTIRSDDKWFWHPAADTPLSAATIKAMRAQVNARRGDYLLNCPPDESGMIPSNVMQRLTEVGMNVLEPTLNEIGTAISGSVSLIGSGLIQ